MDIKKEMEDIADTIMSLKKYDKEGFVTQLKYLVGQLSFFYNRLVPAQGGDPSRTYYKVKNRAKAGQIAYFNLTRGFPKETYDGHYCYIVRDCGVKFIVIPTTSVKAGSAEYNNDFEFDIKLNDFQNELTTRLHVDEIRTVDLQRMNERKKIYDVLTDRETILKEINRILFS